MWTKSWNGKIKRTLTKLLKLHGGKRKTEGKTHLPGSDKVQEINNRSAAEVKLSDNVGTADREKHIFYIGDIRLIL